MAATTPTGARRATPPMMPPGASAVVGIRPGGMAMVCSSAMPWA